MGDYSAATPTPGASWRQDYAIELALRMVAPVEHDGLSARFLMTRERPRGASTQRSTAGPAKKLTSGTSAGASASNRSVTCLFAHIDTPPARGSAH